MGNGNEPNAPVQKEFAGLTGYCSRFAGDSLCRCGSNLKGRFCLWSHYPLPPSFDKHPKKSVDGTRKKL